MKAPKIRACEIIEELEMEQRGIYGGALGYIDFTGNMDTCIAIRMAVKKDGKVIENRGFENKDIALMKTETRKTSIKIKG